MTTTALKASSHLRKVFPIYPTTFDPFQRPYQNGFHVTLRPEMLQEPFSYAEPALVFGNSMADWFHKDVPYSYVDMMLGVMNDCPTHHFQMLTKRADQMKDYFACRTVPDNVWLGVSVENRSQGVPRIQHLQAIKTTGVRWLSVEPLLEDLGMLDLDGIDWVVAGGESGGKAVRPMNINWVRSIRDQCVDRGIAFFFKQWGSFNHEGVFHHKGNGQLLDGREWKEFPTTTYQAQERRYALCK